MEVISIEEQEDGSALVTLNMTEEENNMLIGFAVNTILKEQIEKMEKENEMREIKLGICFFDKDDNIIAKKPLETKWSVDLEQDLSEKSSNHVIDEIANILTSGLKLSLTPDSVKDMLLELKECQG